MNIILLGSGGRENALAWKIAQSSQVNELYILPGNPGTAKIGKNIDINITDFERIKKFALNNNVEMIVVGPEGPLAEGIYDFIMNDKKTKDITVIGPSKNGARLEESKDFAKSFMMRHNIPTAKYKTVTKKNVNEGIEFLHSLQAPYVLKADGLCAGKGVLILPTLAKAKDELFNMLDGAFGEASKSVVIEEFLSGIECSMFVLTDGKDYKILPEAKDYKRIGEGDTGLNTGGMGSVSPVSFATKEWVQKVENNIIRPTIEGLKDENIDYKGFIFFGLINVDGEPKLIEYNCRMGDPETESVMLRIKSDIVDLFCGVKFGDLSDREIIIDERTVACVILVSGGYPEKYNSGYEITGLDNIEKSIVFHSGTIFTKDHNNLQKVLTNGGRVLAISSYGNNKIEALRESYKVAKKINFKDKYYRRDIGWDL